MKKLIYLFFLLLFLLIMSSGCGSACKSKGNDENKKEKHEQNYFEGSFYKLPNNSFTHSIIIEGDQQKTAVVEAKEFLIVENKKGEILLKDFIPLGKLFWKNDSLVQVEKYPGTISKDQSENTGGYTFNVISREQKEL